MSNVRIAAHADLPTHHGRLSITSFTENDVTVDDVALSWKHRPSRSVARVRVHSECLTGDVLHSLRCDCRDQLELGLLKLAEGELDLILYLRQEGRGIGLGNKVRAYSLQDAGLDTVEANERLGFEDDCRDYRRAAGMLRALGVERVVLYTNNPNKLDGLALHGIDCVQRAEFLTAAREENIHYLRTKATKSGHWINLPPGLELGVERDGLNELRASAAGAE